MNIFSIFKKVPRITIVRLRLAYMASFNEFESLLKETEFPDLQCAMKDLSVFIEEEVTNSKTRLDKNGYCNKNFENKLTFYAELFSAASDVVKNPEMIDEFKKEYLNKSKYCTEIVLGILLTFISALVVFVALCTLIGMTIGGFGWIGIPMAIFKVSIGTTGMGMGSALATHGIFNLKRKRFKSIQNFTYCIT